MNNAEPTIHQPLTDAHYAGFWIRFLSVIIDLVVCAPFCEMILRLMGPGMYWQAEGLLLLLLTLYYGVFFSSRLQATPGMYALKFHITDIYGNRIGFARALAWLLSSVLTATFCMGAVLYLQSRFDLTAVRDLQFSCIESNMAPEDCASEIESLIHIPYADYQHLIQVALGLTLFLLAIWGLSIALPKDKTGFHNLMCGTRFVKGRVTKT